MHTYIHTYMYIHTYIYDSNNNNSNLIRSDLSLFTVRGPRCARRRTRPGAVVVVTISPSAPPQGEPYPSPAGMIPPLPAPFIGPRPPAPFEEFDDFVEEGEEVGRHRGAGVI